MEPIPLAAGFVSVIVDVPFLLAVPNDTYRVHHPEKGLALVETIKREGSRAFFRNMPVTGPTPFADSKRQAQAFFRLQQPASYILTSQSADGSERATLNVHTGEQGGFAEARPYTEVHVTYVVDDLVTTLNDKGAIIAHVRPLLNGFLDRYRLVAQDYRITRIGEGRNFYLATVHTSPLREDERGKSPEDLLMSLFGAPRTFDAEIGRGAVNILGINSILGLQRGKDLDESVMPAFRSLLVGDYHLLLSYDLLLEAQRCLQLMKDHKLALVHAATAVEAHVLHLLYEILLLNGSTPTDASTLLETDPDYTGVARRLKTLDRLTKDHAATNGVTYTPFLGTARQTAWYQHVDQPRNRAMHAGFDGFTWEDAKQSIVTATDTIVFLDARIPSLTHPIQLGTPHLQPHAGTILF